MLPPGSARADDQVSQAIAVDIARAGDAGARAVIGIDAVDAEAAVPEIGQIDRRRASLAEDHVALPGKSLSPSGSAPDAPTIRSARPSPLTSPAPETLTPEKSSTSMPSMRKPLARE